MNQPIKDYWETAADTCVAQYKELFKVTEAAVTCGAMDILGPLHETIWQTFDAMLDLIDPTKWISWFIYDNNCGKNARKACGPGQKLRTIRTTKQLARLIRASH